MLNCESCGGKLTSKTGRVFVCAGCGMEYSSEWAKEKFSPVLEPDGKWMRSGDFIELGKMALRRREWDNAKRHFYAALEIDKEKAEAYLGLALAEWELSELEDKYEWVPLSRQNVNYRRALQFASVPLLKRMISARKKAQAQFDEEVERARGEQRKKELALGALRGFVAPFKRLASVGNEYTVGLKADGTLIAAGTDMGRLGRVNEWTDIKEVSAGGIHIVGLRNDGTVVTTSDAKELCDVSEWRDITAVAAGYCHTVGLRKDGTVAAVCWKRFKEDGQCGTESWRQIIAVDAGARHTVGLRANGTVVAAGNNAYGQCEVSQWSRIVDISAGHSHTVGLKADGTVVATGSNSASQCGVQSWNNIVAVSAGVFHTVGLRSDGTVVAAGSKENDQCRVGQWRHIVAVKAGREHTLGVTFEGTAVAAGFRYHMEHHSNIVQEVHNWKLFNRADYIDNERRLAAQLRELGVGN